MLLSLAKPADGSLCSAPFDEKVLHAYDGLLRTAAETVPLTTCTTLGGCLHNQNASPIPAKGHCTKLLLIIKG